MRVAASLRLILLVLSILLVAGLGLAPRPVRAHAELIDTLPSAGSALVAVPDELRLTFTETVDPRLSNLTLLSADGTSIPVGPTTIDPADAHVLAVEVPNAASLAAGTYTVVWSAYSSEDDHTSTGSFTFSAGTGIAPANASQIGNSVSADAIIGKWLELIGVVLLTGLAFFVVTTRKTVVVSTSNVNSLAALAAAGLVGAALSLRAREMAITGERFFGPIDGGAVADVLSSTYGQAWIVRSAVLVAVLILSIMRPASTRPKQVAGIALLGVVALATIAVSGHAGAAEPAWLAMTVDFLHMSGAAVWLGGLLGLLLVTSPAVESDGYRSLLRSQGNRYVAAIALIAVAGLASAWWQVGGRRELTGSEYGQTLLIKVALVTAILGVALYNRLVLQDAGPHLSWTPFAIGLELVLAGVVLLFSADLSLTPPANRPLPIQVAARAIALDVSASGSESTVQLTGTLTGDPSDAIVVQIAPATDLQRVIVRTQLSDSSAGTEVGDRFDVDPVDPAQGVFQFASGRLGIAGEWLLEITVRRAGVEDEVIPVAVDTSSLGDRSVRWTEDRWGGVRGTSHTVLALTLAGLVLLVGVGGMRRLTGFEPAASAFLLAAWIAITGGFLVSAARSTVPVTEAHAEESPVAIDQGLLTDAGDLYRSNCASCHGADGAGASDGNVAHLHGNGADLTRPQAVQQSDGDLWYWISNGVPGSEMPAFSPALIDEERWILVAYLRELQAEARARENVEQ